IRDTRLAGSLQAPALSEVLQDHSLSVLRQRTVLALQRRSESINATDRHPLRLRHLLCRRLVAEQLLRENLYGPTEALDGSPERTVRPAEQVSQFLDDAERAPKTVRGVVRRISQRVEEADGATDRSA